MSKNKKSFIALLLVAVLLVTSSPISVSALEASEGTVITETDSVDELTSVSQTYDSEEIIGEVEEIIDLREENVKHFRLADGTYEAVVYAEAVHRKDENGDWQDIDNTLELISDNGSPKYISSDSRVKFAEKFTANSELLSLNENGYSISMLLLEDHSATPQGLREVQNSSSHSPTVNNATGRKRNNKYDSLEEATRIDNKSSITYNNVSTNTNLEYILQGNDIKESIIVTAMRESYEYTFELRLAGLVAVLDENGGIQLVDSETSEVKYYIPAPYMFDNDGAYSEDVCYELAMVENGVYTLTVIANESWINAEDRAFPVTIDPTLTVKQSLEDSFTYSTYPNAIYGSSTELWISDTCTTYIQINLPTLPDGATFNSAYLYVSYYYNAGVTDGSLLAGAYQVLSSWDEESLTYNNSPTVSTTRMSTAKMYATGSYLESSPGLACFTITSAATEWYTDASSNYGVALKRESSTTSTKSSVILKSYESGEDYPYISVNYTYYIADGVYALKGMGFYYRWLSIEDPWAENNVQQKYSASSPADADVFDRSCLFKISRVSGTTRYIIRSMVNNNLSFGISDGEVITKEIPSADADVESADTFYIEWDGSGFLLRPYGSSSVIKISSASIPNLTTVAKSSATVTARWSLVQYTGTHKRGSTIYYPLTLNAGTTVTFTPVVWATNIDYNTPNLSVSSGYTDMATATWSESTRTGSFSLHYDGTLKVTSKIYNASQSSYYSFTHTFTLTLPIEEGIYFFKNKEVGKYMQIDDNDDPDYDTSGSHMELWDFDGGDYQKWELIHLGDGYYKILSVKSGMALCVPSGSTNEDEVALIQQPYSNLSRKKWKITKSSSGAYILRPKSSEGYSTDWCMCAGDQFLWITDGLNVEQQAYVNNSSYEDEWIICDFDTSLLLAIDDSDGSSRHSYFSSTKSNLQTEKNGTISITSTARYSSASVATMIGYLQSSNIFIVHTHGYQNGFKISNSGTTFITSTDLTGINLSNLSFALLMTCHTGDNYDPANITNNTPVNIIEQMVICGAETVVGFNDSTWVYDCNKFGPDITSKLISGGLSVDDAIESISYTFYIKNMWQIAVVAGNGNNKLR